jgi:hypothetical protein
VFGALPVVWIVHVVPGHTLDATLDAPTIVHENVEPLHVPWQSNEPGTLTLAPAIVIENVVPAPLPPPSLKVPPAPKFGGHGSAQLAPART